MNSNSYIFSEVSANAMRSYAVGIVKFCAVAQNEVKCVTHARRHLTMRRIASRAEGVLIALQGTLSKKRPRLSTRSFFWSG